MIHAIPGHPIATLGHLRIFHKLAAPELNRHTPASLSGRHEWLCLSGERDSVSGCRSLGCDNLESLAVRSPARFARTRLAPGADLPLNSRLREWLYQGREAPQPEGLHPRVVIFIDTGYAIRTGATRLPIAAITAAIISFDQAMDRFNAHGYSPAHASQLTTASLGHRCPSP